MKKYFLSGLFLILIGNVNSQTTEAKQGESMWVLLNHVKADKRQQFEKFVYEVLFPALKENAKKDIISRNIIEQTRMLEPRRANKDSSYTYIWLMDPIVKNADYSYSGILSQVYSSEDTKKYISMHNECLVSPQFAYRVKQGSW
ncbi:MAG: hypothetical protein HN653_07500 [Candidatus Marinimicrobia bacterium]|nr:hypothetical protein [Candidatus Neomarinimicrobiota bacterium]MBT7525500.1 hypothetical protein [Candidatus Neomarinimicrobiota bacterium]